MPCEEFPVATISPAVVVKQVTVTMIARKSEQLVQR